MKSRHTEANNAKDTLGESRCRSIWESVLAETCDCYAGPDGNHPCDNGATCCKCLQEWVAEEYTTRLILAGGGNHDKAVNKD